MKKYINALIIVVIILVWGASVKGLTFKPRSDTGLDIEGHCVFDISSIQVVDQNKNDLENITLPAGVQCWLIITDSHPDWLMNGFRNVKATKIQNGEVKAVFAPAQLYCSGINYENYFSLLGSKANQQKEEFKTIHAEIKTQSPIEIYYYDPTRITSDPKSYLATLNSFEYSGARGCGPGLALMNIEDKYYLTRGDSKADETYEPDTSALPGGLKLLSEFFSEKGIDRNGGGAYGIQPPSDDSDDSDDSDESYIDSPGKPNDKYSGIETCSDVDIKRIKACGCIPAEIADITSKIYFILRIVGPVLLLILGGFDMAKAIATQDESAIEKAKKKLVNKFIAAAAIFLVLTVIEFVVGLLAKDATSTMKCIDILLNGYFI